MPGGFLLSHNSFLVFLVEIESENHIGHYITLYSL